MLPRQKRQRKCYMEPGSTDSIPKAATSRFRANSDRTPSTQCPGETRPLPTPSAPMPRPQQRCSSSELYTESIIGDKDQRWNSPLYEASTSEDEQESTIENGSSEIGPQAGDGHSFLSQPEFRTPFHDSGTLSLGDEYVMLLDHMLRVGLNWSDVVDLQQLINKLVEKVVFPEIKYLFMKFFGVNPAEMTFHFYCQSCMNEIARTTGGIEERKNVAAQHTSCM
ncbi:unnamed protein product [Ixodes persulcatus]